jgi:hypothetical protein
MPTESSSSPPPQGVQDGQACTLAIISTHTKRIEYADMVDIVMVSALTQIRVVVNYAVGQ